MQVYRQTDGDVTISIKPKEVVLTGDSIKASGSDTIASFATIVTEKIDEFALGPPHRNSGVPLKYFTCSISAYLSVIPAI